MHPVLSPSFLYHPYIPNRKIYYIHVYNCIHCDVYLSSGYVLWNAVMDKNSIASTTQNDKLLSSRVSGDPRSINREPRSLHWFLRSHTAIHDHDTAFCARTPRSAITTLLFAITNSDPRSRHCDLDTAFYDPIHIMNYGSIRCP